MNIYKKIKSTLEPIFALIALIILFPTILIIIIAIKIESNGAVFLCQKRIGKQGKPFYIYKFRTMVVMLPSDNLIITKSETDQTGVIYDPRITKVGQFLRRTSLDELPQFLNVIKGEMSFFGPRPIFESELKFLKSNILNIYFQLKPGLMSPEIVNKSAISTGNNSEEQYYKKIIAYHENMSFINDLKILIKYLTIFEPKGY